MSKRDITIALLLVAVASGFIGLKIGESRADTRIEVVEQTCEQTTAAAVERVEARSAACTASSRRAELALGMLPARAADATGEYDAPDADGGVRTASPVQPPPRPAVTDPETRAAAVALVEEALARRSISSRDREAFAALMPQLSQADQELLVERVMTALHSGQLTINEDQ